MYFEEIATRDIPQLLPSNPFFWLEQAIKKETPLKNKQVHDQEHIDMLKSYGCKPEHTSKLTIRFDGDGVAFADRMYHILLHLRFWKDTNNKELFPFADRFETQSGLNLDDLTLPSPTTKGESIY